MPRHDLVERDGDILLEVSDAVRKSLIASMDSGGFFIFLGLDTLFLL
jgi:hypothetical protein